MNFKNFEIEDYRLYLVIGAVGAFSWCSLPLLVGTLNSDALVTANQISRVAGQLLLLAVALPLIPERFRFVVILLSAMCLSLQWDDYSASRCDMALERFHFQAGDYPTCARQYAI